MKVMKFGGSCLKNREYLLRAVEIIKSQKESVVIVVSAFNGITNKLLDGINLSICDEKNIPDFIAILKSRHRFFFDPIIQEKSIHSRIKAMVDALIQKIEKLLYGISYTQEVTESVKSLVLSYGERMSAVILAGILQSAGKDAVALFAEKIGMVTDDVFENATALLTETRDNFKNSLLPIIKKGCIPVITGYFGITRSGKISIFGRNGSDYSAAVISYAVEAKYLELWKDVDGFMSADPLIIRHARPIDCLSYNEAAELSYFGARIMHPRTTEPLLKMGIKVYIRNIQHPGKIGTVIFPDGYEKDDIIKSVTCNKQIAILRVFGTGVGRTIEVYRSSLQRLALCENIAPSVGDFGSHLLEGFDMEVDRPGTQNAPTGQ